MLRLYGSLVKSTRWSSGSSSGKYSWKLGVSSDRVVKTSPVGVTWWRRGAFCKLLAVPIRITIIVFRITCTVRANNLNLLRNWNMCVASAPDCMNRLLCYFILDDFTNGLESRQRTKKIPGLDNISDQPLGS